MKTVKNNLNHITCIALGLWNFIMLAFNYFALPVPGLFALKFSGYNIMDLSGDADFAATMMVILQILVLIWGILLLVWGTIGLLKNLGVIKNFPEKLAKAFDKKWGEIGAIVLAALNVLLMVFLIIFVVKNDCKLRSGVFFAILIAAAAFAVMKVFGKTTDKKEEAVEEKKEEAVEEKKEETTNE